MTDYTDGNIDTNRSANPHLNDLIEVRYSRRQTLMGGLSAATAAVFGGMLLAGCDDDGGNGSSPVTVTAGSSANAAAGRPVTLTGNAIGQVDSVAWTQVSGPTVALTNANTATASFIAPGVANGTALVFRFTATAASGTTTAETTVTIGGASLGFTAVPKSLADVVAVPAGYNVTVLYRLGDPIASGVSAYANNGTDTNFARRAGDHHDGMSYFGLSAAGAPDANGNTRGLLVLNHENITQAYLHPNGPTTVAGVRPEAEALKEMECHGVSVVEVNRATDWSYAPTSSFNRRITPLTPMSFSGPVRGADTLKTRYSTDGTAGRGTINNCANGTMPWNTYLTNEENWVGYFRREVGDAARRAATGAVGVKANTSLTRYGKPESNTGGNYGWATVTPADTTSTLYARWNITAQAGAPADGTGDFRNEIFQYGWVVEIDPFDPASTPRKRTALGRMNHEGCQIGRTIAGVKPAFYMGDDAQNEYIYKFVSNAAWSAADATNANRLAMGDKYLDAGTLYVAKFNADGSGQWLPLVYNTGVLTSANATYAFSSQADVLTNVRLAADVLGATKMDRPEWTAVNPATGEMYCTLTNNASRTAAGVDASNPRAYTDPKTDGRAAGTGNVNGHVIRLRESGDSSEATTFAWDIYAFGAGSDLDAANINLSGLDATNDFSSPDGMWFGLPSNASGLITPVLWLQTDDGAYTDVTNCMMLAAIPGTVNDGATRSVTNTLGGATSTVTTRIGKAPGASLRRFLVGPKECEITGIHSTPDGRSLFLNIQHPGENATNPNAPTSNWPANQSVAAAGQRPRSATVVITKADGGVVGL
ncbi:PhoX family phosphatase [Sphingomonas ginsenosidivorax]|uniref:PhoX family phosphatase n=1 Tax=Sphingomonas ginsenosidivorax TaxID=862135 RepID=A0A5C6UGB6_9SPHN|nr:PhoX family phosphatase [Sphingomonas ginsenosidivorax]TXC71206.1 PhoX family phosphatase [Sphingomonas ginsenosidivorax]